MENKQPEKQEKRRLMEQKNDKPAERICDYCHKPITVLEDLRFDNDKVPFHSKCYNESAEEYAAQQMKGSGKGKILEKCEPDAVLNQEEVRKKARENPNLEKLSDDYRVAWPIIQDILANTLAPYPDVAIVTVQLTLPPRFVEILNRFLVFTGNTLANLCQSELILCMQNMYRDILGVTDSYPGLASDADYLDELKAITPRVEDNVEDQDPQSADIDVPKELIDQVTRYMKNHPGVYTDIQAAICSITREGIKKEQQEKLEPK